MVTLGMQSRDLTRMIRGQMNGRMSGLSAGVGDWRRGLRDAARLGMAGAAVGSLVENATSILPMRRRRRWTDRAADAATSFLAMPLRALMVGFVVGYVLGFVLCRRTMSGGSDHSDQGDQQVNGADEPRHAEGGARRQSQRMRPGRARSSDRPDIPPASAGRAHGEALVDVTGMDSFPASDPPSTLGSISPSRE